jgi:glycosyltransferase involved in cell wall biosynthesis
VNFSVVTPSYRNSKWLKLCVASVADQEGLSFEHIVQDSCSDDGTGDWLPKDKRVKAFIEKDQGMYDAINRGYKRSQGEILTYLNCDEQFLPGALKAVYDYFQAHPDVDVVLTDTVVTEADGSYICHRPSMVPLKHHLWYRFAVLTCALFIRRRVVTEYGLYFDTRWRDIGDMFWILESVNRGVRMDVLRSFTSIFAETGDNMNLKPNAQREKAIQAEMTPKWVKRMRRAIILYHKMRLLASGTYFQKPFDYSLYTFASPDRRVTHHVARPTALWRGRY